jgi:hypothetical protein
MDHNAQGRRPHYHRGRRGSERRGGDRRASQQSPEPAGRPAGEHLDVEQIMRDIRARIAQRHGIELTTAQVQELAARRLEAILDPRTISPALTEQLRKAASHPIDVPLPAVESGYTFESSTLFETHRGFLRFMRRLLNPILKLFFNPNPLIHALSTQARLNKDAAARETERERRQVEWNALHYEILNRLVTEISRVSIEMQALSTRVESLAGRVDFNDRRVRVMESAATQARPQHARGSEAPVPSGGPTVTAEPLTSATAGPDTAVGDGATRRKRRRRRGRRSSGGAQDASFVPESIPQTAAAADADRFEAEDTDDDDGDVTVEPEALAEVAPPVIETAAPAPPPVIETSPPAPPDASAAEPVQPAPPPDEPVPASPVDHPDPGPPDR